MAASLLLDQTTWDLVVDASGNIAVCTEPYSDAQDAACHQRLFQSELLYDTTQGVPYWAQILGKWPPMSLVKSDLTFAALEATNVVTAAVSITSFKGRLLSGVTAITNSASQTSTSSFSVSSEVASL